MKTRPHSFFFLIPCIFFLSTYLPTYLFMAVSIYLSIYGCVGSSLLSIYLWLCCVFIAACGFLQLWRAGATLRCSVQASRCGGFSCCGARAVGTRASVVVARGLSCGSQALECRLSSCSAWAQQLWLAGSKARAQLLRSTWDLPGPGLEPVSPALADGFLTTPPSGKHTRPHS